MEEYCKPGTVWYDNTNKHFCVIVHVTVDAVETRSIGQNCWIYTLHSFNSFTRVHVLASEEEAGFHLLREFNCDFHYAEAR